jgi:Fe-S-cluster containining protein
MNQEEFKDMIQDSPFVGSPVEPTMLADNAQLQFRCHRDVKCWNACCSNIDITLTPYDILRLKKRLEISSGEFLQKYTIPFEMDKDGMPGVKLKPVDEGSACQFMKPEGCGVYEDRPTSCRYYPVALLTMRRSDEYVDRTAFALVKEKHCLGHFEPKTQSIEAYRTEQGVAEYDEKGRSWRQLVIKRKSAGPTIGTPSPISNQLFFMASYDVDRFRAFVMSKHFNETYIVPPEVMALLVADDEALLDFGLNFLRHVLFAEKFIEEYPDALDRRLARKVERTQQAQDAAFEAKMALEDDKYSGENQ